jgi:hypothetical protein
MSGTAVNRQAVRRTSWGTAVLLGLALVSAASWFCWAIPLLITEVVLQGKKVFKASSPAGGM